MPFFPPSRCKQTFFLQRIAAAVHHIRHKCIACNIIHDIHGAISVLRSHVSNNLGEHQAIYRRTSFLNFIHHKFSLLLPCPPLRSRNLAVPGPVLNKPNGCQQPINRPVRHIMPYCVTSPPVGLQENNLAWQDPSGKCPKNPMHLQHTNSTSKKAQEHRMHDLTSAYSSLNSHDELCVS